MGRSSRSDIELLLAYVRKLYVCRDQQEFAAHLVATLSELIPANAVAYNEVDTASGTMIAICNPAELNSPELLRSFEHHMHEHPIINHYRISGDGSAFKFSDFVTRKEYRRLGLYHECYRKIDADHQIALAIPSSATKLIGIALNRAGRDFSERDRILLNLLRPHLEQAYRNAQAVTRSRREFASLTQAIEASDRGLILLGEKGRMQLCSNGARRQLSDYFDDSLQMTLPEPIASWVAYEEVLLKISGDVPSPRVPLIIEKAGRQLAIRLITDGTDSDRMLLLEEQPRRFSAGALAALGLTNRESEILVCVAQGMSDKKIAATIGRSLPTVKKHLEHVLHKLDVESRSQAVARVLEKFKLVQG